jgi:single-strand DNA-binding protein
MSDLAVAIVVGRLTRDAELKYTNSGQAVCHFTVATGSRRKKGDQWVEESSFWDVDFWGKGGESINQYLTKAKLVAVEGTMRQDRWEQDGQTRSKIIINANTVQLLGSPSGGTPGNMPGGTPGNMPGGTPGASPSFDRGPGRDNRDQGQAQQRPPGRGQESPSSGDDFTDDIPF